MKALSFSEGEYCFKMTYRVMTGTRNAKIFKRKDTKPKKGNLPVCIMYSTTREDHLFVNITDLIDLVWSCKHTQAHVLRYVQNNYFRKYHLLTASVCNFPVPLRHLHVVMTDVCPKDPVSCSELLNANIPAFVWHARKMFRLTLVKMLDESKSSEPFLPIGKKCLKKLNMGGIL